MKRSRHPKEHRVSTINLPAGKVYEMLMRYGSVNYVATALGCTGRDWNRYIKTHFGKSLTELSKENIVKTIDCKGKKACISSFNLGSYFVIYKLYTVELKNPEFYEENLKFLFDNVETALSTIDSEPEKNFSAEGEDIKFEFSLGKEDCLYIEQMFIKTKSRKPDENKPFKSLFERDAYSRRKISSKVTIP